MPVSRKPTLENSKATANPNDQVQAAIDPTGGVKLAEPRGKSGAVIEELKAAIDPTGAVKKTDLL